MSKIFTMNTTTQMAPRPDARIRVRYYPHPPVPHVPEEYREAMLWAFHPDYDKRAKFRGMAYLKPEPWMQHSAYERWGDDFLPPEEVYVAIREFMVHEEDRLELYRYCIQYNRRNPLIVRPCLVPFPMFSKGERVKVVSLKNDRLAEVYSDPRILLGEMATCTEKSSGGAMTTIRFDREELNRGFKHIGFSSIDLRQAE